MNIRHMLIAGLTTFGALTVLATPAQGGIILIGGENGTTDPPAPTTGSKSEEDWNPTVDCTLEADQGLDELLYCLQDGISNPPPSCPPPPPPPGPGPVRVRLRVLDDPNAPCVIYPFGRDDFYVWTIQPPNDQEWGIGILKKPNYDEINRLTLRENDPGIKTSELRLAASGKVARIRLIDEQPAGDGSVYLTLNTTQVSVLTGSEQSPGEINAAIILQLSTHFSVTVAGQYLHVQTSGGAVNGITKVGFRSTDTGIISSDLS